MQRMSLVATVLGLIVLAVFGLSGGRMTVLQGWVFAAQFWTGLSLGAAVLLITHAITGGRWGEALRPILRAGTAALPVAVVAWVPLIFVAGSVFPWATTPVEDLPQTVVKKLFYLDVGFLQLRTVVVLALFIGIGWIAGAWSHRQPGLAASTTALMVYAFAISVLSIDWLLAFEPEFYSTAYPPIHATGGVVAAMALATLALWANGGSVDRLADCAMLMLAWAMIWLYLIFMQYLIIWSGDLPQEIHWYLVRLQGGWSVPLWLGILCHVAVVAAMTSPRLKRRPDAVAAAAAALVLGQMLDLWWRTAPAFVPAISLSALADLAALVALGGFWTATAMAARQRRSGTEVARG